MRSLALSVLAIGALQSADALHVPLLVKYHQESHLAAGFILGYGLDYALRKEPIHPLGRYILVTGAALMVGAGKEYLIDKNPNHKEIAPWGWGAATAVTIRFSF